MLMSVVGIAAMVVVVSLGRVVPLMMSFFVFVSHHLVQMRIVDLFPSGLLWTLYQLVKCKSGHDQTNRHACKAMCGHHQTRLGSSRLASLTVSHLSCLFVLISVAELVAA